MNRIVDACRDFVKKKWNIRFIDEEGKFHTTFLSDEKYRIERLREKLIDSGAAKEDLDAFELFIRQEATAR